MSTVVAPQAWRHATPDALFDALAEGAVRAEVRGLAQGGEYVVPVPASLSVGFKPT